MNGGMDEKKRNTKKDGCVVEFEFYCQTPGVEKEPVVLTVFHDGELIDTISFTKKGSVRKQYELKETPREEKGQVSPRLNTLEENPVQLGKEVRSRGSEGGKEQKLLLEVSRTWIPHEHLGNFDRRELGVGVKIVSSK